MLNRTHNEVDDSRASPQWATMPGGGQHAVRPRRVEPVPEGVARRAKGGARRGRTGTSGSGSCCLRMDIGRKSIVQHQVWPPVVVEPHGLLERRFGLSLRSERPIHLVLLLQNAVDPLGHGVLVTVQD